MRVTRVFVEQALVSGKGVGLPEQAGLHLTRVLRLEAGAAVTLFDGTGGEYEATLERDGKKIWARVGAHSAIERESPLHVTLIQGVARGERMDLIVQKATELGVTRIVPVFAERSVVKVDASKSARKLEHWRSIAISACEQCGRNRVPEVRRADDRARGRARGRGARIRGREWLHRLRDGPAHPAHGDRRSRRAGSPANCGG